MASDVDGHLEPTALEHHSGVIAGRSVRTRVSVGSGASPEPRSSLERIVAAALARGPCVVQFSGGRDSSLVLAVAADVARRHGFAPPVALSVRYPGVGSSQESAWQDLVVAHLGVPHEIVEVPPGDNELCAPLAFSRLLRHGALLPPPCGVSLGRIGPQVGGRTVLTGQGGDEVLGHSRVTAYIAHWRRRRRPSAAAARAMAHDGLPRPLRRGLAWRELRERRSTTWLTTSAERAVVRGIVNDQTDAPWDWRAARWQAPLSRMWVIGSSSIRSVALGEGFEIVHPLMDEDFVAALCARGGPLGITTRTEAMRVLAGDLLPESVLTRSTKAYFNNVYAGDRVRAFARDWDGSGVDRDLVDVERLRAAWMDPTVPGASLAPLQLALLAAADRGWEPEGGRGAADA